LNDIIHLLPDSVANQIAAGEVVQRPSSIIKEMVENSIDAGATLVKVLVVDGGKTSVQVIDDGKGMSETDARLAFDRHATSKILKADDLFSLTTMGFRGEALASIAAVAQVELTTRRPGDELGTLIQISGSKLDRQEPVACPVGSNFSVKNLFFNVPARRKFLKSNQTELNNVIQDFERIVLVHPHISFHLFNNGAEMYRLPQASVRQRIIDVFGKKINSDLLPIDAETSLVSISGYVGKPESSKKKGARQFLFVNGRYMRHPYFHSAVMKAYEGLIPVGEHVSYFIYFSVDPSTIDVNVHPTKTEIKFDNEQPIWQVLSATVRETIGKFSNVPLIDFDVEGKPDIPVMGTYSSIPSQPKEHRSDYNPFHTDASVPSYSRTDNWEALYSGINDSKPENPDSQLVSSGMNNILVDDSEMPSLFDTLDAEPGLTPSTSNVFMPDLNVGKFQLHGQYIVMPAREGLLLVDQHRAHVRVLFEENMESMKSHRRAIQKLLFPEIIQFTKSEAMVVDDMLPEMNSLGFELTSLGGGSYSVSGTPSGIEGINVDTLLHEMVLTAIEHTGDARIEMQEALSLSLAQSSAIVYGQVLSTTEIDHLLKDLFLTDSPARTPDGKLVYSIVDNKFIEKLF